MSITNIVNRDIANLVNCESEPIHIPGSIQPHGFLLSVNEETKMIDFCSENIAAFIHTDVAQILGKTMADVFGQSQSDTLYHYIIDEIPESSNPFVLIADNISYNTTIHRSNGQLIVEAEPFPDGALSLPNLYRQTGRFVSHMEGAGHLIDLCKNIADETRLITGYDRVMIYRFDENYNGEVIAESKREDLFSFSGQKYPHTDIPAQARELYIKNQIRMIADINYEPVPILTLNSSVEKNNSSLDLSLSVLRSVSPIHVEYLKNMGVGATLTVSLLLNKKLWGLIACHHYSAKVLPHFTRLSALLQGHFLTSQITVRETAEEFEVGQRSEEHLKDLFALLSKSSDFISENFDAEQIRKVANATGVIIYRDDNIYTNGDVPSQENCVQLVKLLVTKNGIRNFHTSYLSAQFPEAEAFAEKASGVIYHSLSLINDDCIIWLREEMVETIKWAGNPYKDMEKDDTLSRLTPRKSFELWTEEVRHKSREWKKTELHAAESFAYSLEKHLGLSFSQKQEERYRTLSEELKEANKELANINWISTHDLKEPIRKIQIFASMVLDRDENLSEKTRESVTRMRIAASRMQSLIEDILSYSKTGNSEQIFVKKNLGSVLSDTLLDLKDEIEENNVSIISDELPELSVIPFQIKQLFVNLIGNAIKFTEKGKPVTITVKNSTVKGATIQKPKVKADEDYFCVSIIDNGIGFEAQYAEKIFEVFQRLHTSKDYIGTGIGLAICKKIMENHKGFINAVSSPGNGATMNLYFPKEYY